MPWACHERAGACLQPVHSAPPWRRASQANRASAAAPGGVAPGTTPTRCQLLPAQLPTLHRLLRDLRERTEVPPGAAPRCVS
jgi:hypothetical protein